MHILLLFLLFWQKINISRSLRASRTKLKAHLSSYELDTFLKIKKRWTIILVTK
jgi:hypothetical protein